MESESKQEEHAGRIELFRPREIENDPRLLEPTVGLFGTCGSPASTWRQDIFIPKLEKKGIPYFNPQVGPNEWVSERARTEAEHLSRDEVIVLPISKETYGYASLSEGGWAMLSALMRGQKLGIYIEEDETMPEEAKRARVLFKELSEQIQKEYPVFQFEETMEDLALWAAITARERFRIKNSKINDKRSIELPADVETENTVGIFGTSSFSEWKQKMKERFESAGISYFDSYKEDWSAEDANNEITHKLKDKVLLQIISGETEGFGSLAESGLLALSAFVRGQAYGLYIEDHPSDPESSTNRARTLVRAHVTKLNEQFPGIVYLADSIENLTQFATTVMKQN